MNLLYIRLLVVLNFGSSACKMTKLIFPCETWQKEYPSENNVTENCSIKVKEKDVNEFFFVLKNSDFDLELFTFYLNFQKEEVFKTKCAVEPHLWTWTYSAPRGAYEFLKWPKEYGVWSMGLLNMYSYHSLKLNMEVRGNCSVVIGQNETTQRIGMAILDMMNGGFKYPERYEDIRYGSVCYKERVHMSRYWYLMCKHLVCPIEAIGYKCCTSEYYENSPRVVCDGKTTLFDEAWWLVPFIIGLLMFAFSPFLLVKTFHYSIRSESIHHTKEKFKMIQNTDTWLASNPLSFFRIIMDNFQTQNDKCVFVIVILRRICISFLTLIVVFIQVYVHYRFDYHYTVDLVKHSVPLGFRSMVAGYERSKNNFMPLIGGPFIGLGLFLASTLLLVLVPGDLENLIKLGLPNSSKLATSPLTIDIKTRGMLGNIFNIDRLSGYNKLYNLMKAHIYMLINPSFWKLVLQMQVSRFIGWVNRTAKTTTSFILLIAILCVPYITVCVLEWTASVLFYGLPIALFFKVTILSYYRGIKLYFEKFGKAGKVVQSVFIALTIFMILFNIYILTVVFVDSFHFLTRIMIFTFTGFIAYPSTTYAYCVFILTVLMYVSEAIYHIQRTYSFLFKYVRKVCQTIVQKNLFPNVPVAKMENDTLLISKELFMYVVSRHRPIRIEIFFSVLKLIFVTFFLFMAIYTIVSLQRLWHLNPLTQVITALFVCLIPKLWRMLLVSDKYIKDMRETLVVKQIVINYCRQSLQETELSDLTEENEGELRISTSLGACSCNGNRVVSQNSDHLEAVNSQTTPILQQEHSSELKPDILSGYSEHTHERFDSDCD